MRSYAVEEATNLNEIGFPEFTAKLITDTFDAIVAANIRQTEAYMELVQQMTKELKDYVKDTRDDIGGEELLQFLAAVLPADSADAEGSPTKVAVDKQVTAGEVTTLNAALKVKDAAIDSDDPDISNENEVTVPADTNLTETHFKTIMEAVANRLAANNHDLLKEMVKLGILRLVVENGIIETKLLFRTWVRKSVSRHAYSYDREEFQVRARAGTGWLVSMWARASASTRYTSLSTTTTRTTDWAASGTTVNIWGLVRINFKTDYQPLA